MTEQDESDNTHDHPATLVEMEQIVEEQTLLIHDYARRLERERKEIERLEEQVAGLRSQQQIALREVHHRVRNNLQVVVSLINLASANAQGSSTSVFEAVQRRITTILAAHEEFYRSVHVGSVDLGAFLEKIVAQTLASHGIEAGRAQVDIQHQRAVFRVDVAVPLAMLVDELVSCAASAPEGRPVRVSGSIDWQGAVLQVRVSPCHTRGEETFASRIVQAMTAMIDAQLFEKQDEETGEIVAIATVPLSRKGDEATP